jgi:CBS domain-containing protein
MTARSSHPVGKAHGPLILYGDTWGPAVTRSDQAAHADAASIGEEQTLRQAGHLMRELGVGALGVRGENGELQGVISRDLMIESIAAGVDPKTVTVGEVVAFPPSRARTRATFPVRVPAA